MNGAGKLGRLGVAITVMIASLILSVTPAHAAANDTRYWNVGNPGWCLDGDWYGPLLRACDDTWPGQLWQWTAVPTGPFQGLIQLKSTYTGMCLTSQNGEPRVIICGDRADQYWDVWGSNGWVVYQLSGTLKCLRPIGTDVVRGYYSLALKDCPVRTNVPNIFAWHYYTA